MAMHHENGKRARTNRRAAATKPRGQASPARAFPASARLVQRAQSDSKTLLPADVIYLQRAIGNRAVVQLLRQGNDASTGHTSGLRVGPSHDACEQEADQMAQQVVQRKHPIQRVAKTRAAEGFETSNAFTQQLSRTKGRGKPLPNKTRAEFEASFGASFDNVRIHRGADSKQLAQSIQAKAFTHGNDIHFDEGAYNPHSSQGKQLLAHELTHTIQQTGSTVQRDVASHLPMGKQSPIIQRKLSWEATKWEQAKYVDVTLSGSGGVFFVGKEAAEEVVVKPNEYLSYEAALAPLILHYATRGSKDAIKAPGVRVVDSAESKRIKATIESLQHMIKEPEQNDKNMSPQKETKKGRTKRLLDELGKSGTMVQEFVSGRQVGNELKKTQHQHLTGEGAGELSGKSPLHLFLEKAHVIALGRATAGDIFMGNTDRLLNFNPENLMVEEKKGQRLNLIDNVGQDPRSHFITREAEIDDTTKQKILGLPEWKSDQNTKYLVNDQFEEIAEAAWDSLLQGGVSDIRMEDLREARMKQKQVRSALSQHHDHFVQYFSEGLRKGKKGIRKSLSDHDQTLKVLKKRMPPSESMQVLASIVDRVNFINANDIATKGKKVKDEKG